MNLDCVYLGPQAGLRQIGPASVPEYSCGRWRRSRATCGTCLACRQYQPAGERMAISAANQAMAPSNAAEPYQGTCLNRHGLPAGLKDLYAGASVFAVMGGPSLKQMDLSPLARRGVVILSANNCVGALPAGIRPHLWVHSDPARKMHDSIWRDPGILKFTPSTQWDLGRENKRSLRFRQPDGSIRMRPGVAARSMPAVVGFTRNYDFDPGRFLFEATWCNGVSSKAPAYQKWPHVVNTFFIVLKLCHFLGFRTVYLLGADFYMRPDQPYAINEIKSSSAAATNNEKFFEMTLMCDALQPHFLAAGFHVVNCTPGSRLWSFPDLPFAEAIAAATAGFEEPLDTKGWYYDKDK